jgi:hypothetical protein
MIVQAGGLAHAMASIRSDCCGGRICASIATLSRSDRQKAHIDRRAFARWSDKGQASAD